MHHGCNLFGQTTLQNAPSRVLSVLCGEGLYGVTVEVCKYFDILFCIVIGDV